MNNYEYDDYQVIAVHEKVYYEWTTRLFKKRRSGTFEYNPEWIVAKSHEGAKEEFVKRFNTTKVG